MNILSYRKLLLVFRVSILTQGKLLLVRKHLRIPLCHLRKHRLCIRHARIFCQIFLHFPDVFKAYVFHHGGSAQSEAHVVAPLPVHKIVTALPAGKCIIGNFIAVVSGSGKQLFRQGIHFPLLFFRRKVGLLFTGCLQFFTLLPVFFIKGSPLLHNQAVCGNMLRL